MIMTVQFIKQKYLTWLFLSPNNFMLLDFLEGDAGMYPPRGGVFSLSSHLSSSNSISSPLVVCSCSSLKYWKDFFWNPLSFFFCFFLVCTLDKPLVVLGLCLFGDVAMVIPLFSYGGEEEDVWEDVAELLRDSKSVSGLEESSTCTDWFSEGQEDCR